MGSRPGLALALASWAGWAGLAISAVGPRQAYATAELDRKYALETVGALRSLDNVDGLFADYVAQAYQEFFAKQTRFRYQDLGKADSVLQSSKVPYAKAIEDPEILGSLSRSLKTQSLLRTRIFKEGPRYRFTIDWLHSPQMDVLSSVTFDLEDQGSAHGGAVSDGSEAREFAGLGDIKARLKVALTQLLAKVPFIGQVSGRDNGEVTVNLGAATGILRGDRLAVATLEAVKKHPLLKEIVEWQLLPTGTVEIDSVDEALSFGHVIEQEEGHEIGRYQKITRILPRPEIRKEAPEPGAPIDPIEEAPKLGYVTAALWTGGYSRDYSSTSGSSFSGGGFLFGARAAGQLWLNRELFVDADLGYGTYTFSQTDQTGATTPAGSVSGNVFELSLDVGYTYLLTGDFFGPRAWVKVGYMTGAYALPLSTSEATSPYSSKSIFLGLGGDLPIRDRYGVRIDLDFGLFNFGGETGSPDGSTNGSRNARFAIGGYYKYKPRLQFSATVEVQGNGSDFAGASGSPVSLSQKTITFLPAVHYFF